MPTLNFTLSPQAAQRVHDAVSSLSKFSEYVSIEARHNRLILSALNSAKSAYGAINLSSSRLRAKALLAVFRQRYLDSKDKATSIEKCEVRIDDNNPNKLECRLLVKLICKHGVLKTYKLTYEEVDIMHAVFDKDLSPNRWKIGSKVLKEYMEHFGPKAEQLDISSENERAAFTSFTEKLVDGKEILKQPLQTSVALDTADFEEFTAEDGLHIAVSIKDFKTVVSHADSLNVTISAFYGDPGRPLQLQYEREGMNCEFTLMTLSEARSSQNFAAVARARAPPPPRQAATSGKQSNTAAAGSVPETLRGGVGRVGEQDQEGGGGEGEEPAMIMNSEGLRSTAKIPTQPSPAVPHIAVGRSAETPLFRAYSDSENGDGDSEGNHDNDEPVLLWDVGGTNQDRHRSTPRRACEDGDRRARARDDDSTESEEGDEVDMDGVGPTQQVSQARGLFD